MERSDDEKIHKIYLWCSVHPSIDIFRTVPLERGKGKRKIRDRRKRRASGEIIEHWRF